jgi:hypothetical protein
MLHFRGIILQLKNKPLDLQAAHIVKPLIQLCVTALIDENLLPSKPLPVPLFGAL